MPAEMGKGDMGWVKDAVCPDKPVVGLLGLGARGACACWEGAEGLRVANGGLSEAGACAAQNGRLGVVGGKGRRPLPSCSPSCSPQLLCA